MVDKKDKHVNSPEIAKNIRENELERKAATITLSGQQLALYRALSEKKQRLADIYLGALTVLRQTTNPDRIALAGHGLRELIEKIPAFVDITIKAQKENLGAKVRELEGRWETTVKSTECYKRAKWGGLIDGPLARLLKRLQNFFEWFNEHHPRRKAEIAATLKRLDSSRRALPASLEELNIQEWGKIRDFFVDVAHHRKPDTTEEEFNQWLDALEIFLLDRLRPRTFADIESIDEIIKEGESDG